ncbi:MAG: metallophosphoesterase [Elusimicrobia bacterium]|nr:metallophosphoesterase [Elusimicrobiota bacterium]
MTQFLVLLAFLVPVGLVFYLEARWLVGVLVRGRPPFQGFWPRTGERASRALTLLLNTAAVAGGLCLVWGWLVEPTMLEVTSIVLESPKILPQTGRVRIVHLSDFHSEERPRNEPRAVEIVNGLGPDLVLVTGDFINTPAGLKTAQAALAALKPAFGTFLVSGNYDIGLLPENAFRDSPAIMLESGSRDIDIRGTKVRVSGLALVNMPDFRLVMKLLLDKPAYDVFLFHNTDLIKEAASLGIDLYLAGHTHGGQVRLPFYGALVTLSSTGKTYEAGRYRVGPTDLYVNRGLGLEGGLAPRVRFLCRPEITVIDVVAPRSPSH